MATEISDRESALDFLYSRINYERLTSIPYGVETFKLDRMRELLSRVGDPHLGLKAVHLAGTKGKGSTAAMLSSVLQAAGYRTGLYTSPHLERLEERFAIDGACLTERELVGLAAELFPTVQEMDNQGHSSGLGGLTFFEVTTALGFLYFARQNVDIAVLEVGLGGRLDSTNVCQPEVSVITSISFDHTKQLGTTLAEIAREKAGIIKPGVPVVSGVTQDEPRLVIAKIAREQNAPLIERGRDFDFAGDGNLDNGGFQNFDYVEQSKNPPAQIRSLAIPLLGLHQCANAAVAVATLRELGKKNWNISDAVIRQGLMATSCQARIEILGSVPQVILDVAHNVASAQALVDVLRQLFPKERPTLIFASSRDKDIAGMMRVLLPACETLIVTKYQVNPRAMETAELQALAAEAAAQLPGPNLPQIIAEPTPASAWQRARQNQGKFICITGSFFLAAEMRELLRRDLNLKSPALQSEI